MFARVGVSLPKMLVKEVEQERKKLHLTRSAFFKKALEAYVGEDRSVKQEFVKKYARLYAECEKEERNMYKTFASAAHTTVP